MMKLKVKIPSKFILEQEYILQTIFTEFLGISIDIEESEDENTMIVDGFSKKKLSLTNVLFANSKTDWLTTKTMPNTPLKLWRVKTILTDVLVTSDFVPVLYGNDPSVNSFYRREKDSIALKLDIFGSCFFMLTRYEEIVTQHRDEHNRFPAKESLAYKENFLDRPIVNEYVEILWSCLKQLWPSLSRKKRQFNFSVSHDVDNPAEHIFCSLSELIKRSGGDIIKRKSSLLAIKRLRQWWRVKNGFYEYDPLNTFTELMIINEKYNIKSTFNFISDKTDFKMDGCYDIEHPYIREILSEIHQRGNTIGLHASYNTYLNGEATKQEFIKLKQVCEQLGIFQNRWSVRQHYLRCEIPSTFNNWEECGINYDTTLSYAQVSGFRCGVCYEYPLFNCITRKKINVIEQPLLVMEGSVLDKDYMNLGLNKNLAINYINSIKKKCKLFNGTFTLLWHNHRFIKEVEKSIYIEIIK